MPNNNLFYGAAIVIFVTVATVVTITLGPYKTEVFNPPYLRIILNLLLIALPNLYVAIVSAHSFIHYGQISSALLSGALVISGLTAFAAGWISGFQINGNFTVYSLGMLISSILQAFGAVYISASVTANVRTNRKPIIAIILAASTASILALTLLVLFGPTPTLFTNSGATVQYQFLTGLSVIFFGLASIIFMLQYYRIKAKALYWYSLALALFSIGSFCAYSITSIGDLIHWTSRIAYYLGSFFFVTALLALRQHAQGADFADRWFETFVGNRSQFNSLFSQMLTGFAYMRIITDKNKKPIDCFFLQINEAFERIFNMKKEDVVGKQLTQLIPGIREDSTDWVSVFGKVGLTGEQTMFESYSRELQRWLNISAYSPEKGYIVTLFEDITSRKQAEKQLKESERLAAIGQTAGMVEHDIRSPLQTIINELYLAKIELEKLPKTEESQSLKESMDFIEKETGYIDKIVMDLQDVTRPLKPELIMVNLCEVIPETLANVDIPKNIQYSFSCDMAETKIRTDVNFLRRIMINLVTNAVQAMPSGGKLTVMVTNTTNQTRISVEDTGVGIPEGKKEKLFTPLFTTKAKGQGFGLLVIKRMAEALEGNVSLESIEGKGTIFTVSLPKKVNNVP